MTPSAAEKESENKQVLDDLLYIDRNYGNIDNPRKIRRQVVSFLGALINAENIESISQLAESNQGLDLLREPECMNRLAALRQRPDAAENVRAAADKILARCGQVRSWWLPLWPTERPSGSRNLRDWLKTADLAFDPFGPEVAELDPLLTCLNVDPLRAIDRTHWHSDCPALLVGTPGSGKTAEVLLLSNSCRVPVDIDSPLNNVFPVYCPTWGDIAAPVSRCTSLETLAQFLSRAIIRYIAWDPLSFLNLSLSRQSKLHELLALCAGPPKLLIQRLNELGSGTSKSSY